MPIHYQGLPSKQIVDNTITGYGAHLDLKPTSYGSLGTEPKVTSDVRKVSIGKAMPVSPENLIAIKSSDIDALLSGSSYSEYDMDINYIESNRTRRTASAIRAGKFNLFNGKFAPSYPVVSNDSFGNDNAARVSYDNPGSVFFMMNGNIITKPYEPKG